MNTLTTEQKARIFAMHLGQKMSVVMKDGNLSGQMTVYSETIRNIELKEGHEDKVTFKLLLRPLSAITDEDAILIANLLWDTGKIDEWKIWAARTTVTHYFTNTSAWDDSQFDTGHTRKMICDINALVLTFLYQFLTQKGYAVPVFVNLDHPDNGKTAIEMGLAIAISTPQTSSSTTASTESIYDGNKMLNIYAPDHYPSGHKFSDVWNPTTKKDAVPEESAGQLLYRVQRKMPRIIAMMKQYMPNEWPEKDAFIADLEKDTYITVKDNESGVSVTGIRAPLFPDPPPPPKMGWMMPMGKQDTSPSTESYFNEQGKEIMLSKSMIWVSWLNDTPAELPFDERLKLIIEDLPEQEQDDIIYFFNTYYKSKEQ